MGALELTSLRKAIMTLEKALLAYQKDPKNENNFARDAAIQRFEYTYELCHKMLRRYLEITEPEKEVIDQLTFPDLIRLAAERGLVLNSWDQWAHYRDARNTTSHAYNEDKAIAIVEDIPDFLTEAKFLLKQLER